MDGIDLHIARETVVIWSHFWIILGIGIACDVAFWFLSGAIARRAGGDGDKVAQLGVAAILLLATLLFALLGSVSTTTTITWKG